jgi:hypothetical protein
MIKGLLAVFTAFYVVEYCDTRYKLLGGYDCKSVESCGYIRKCKDLEEALEFINQPRTTEGFRFQGLYTVSNVSLHLETRKKTRTVTFYKEEKRKEEYEVNEWVY